MYRKIFRIGKGCPITSFYWQCGTLKVEQMILQKQLVFMHHLANLPADCLAREVFDLQEFHLSSHLLQQCEEHLSALNFTVNRYTSKWQWRKIVRSYIKEYNRKVLLEEMKSYKKINYNECVNESFERKSYFFDLDLEPDVRNCQRKPAQQV